MVKLLSLLVACAVLATATAAEDQVPVNFDSRAKWYGAASQIMNQQQCGSCWAVSAVSVFADRASIWLTENGTAIPEGGLGLGNRLFQRAGSCKEYVKQEHDHGCKRATELPSPQAMLSCASLAEDRTLYPDSAGCGGGWSSDAWRYMYLHGVSTMAGDGASGCTPYTSGHCHGKDPHANGCRLCAGVVDQCEDSGLTPTFYRVGSFGRIHDAALANRVNTSTPRPPSDAEALRRQVLAMQREIQANGPVQVCIDYFANFGPFFNANPLGIYNSTEGGPQTGGHCLNVIGWGHDEAADMDFWLVKNTWGEGWANGGVFRFVRGQDLCNIESDVWTGCPANSNCKLTAGVTHNETHVPLGAEDHPLLKLRLGESFISLALVEPRPVDSENNVRSNSPGPAAPAASSRGGFWHEIAREHLVKEPFATQLAHAFEQAYSKPTSPALALKTIARVYAHGGVQGLKLRVVFNDGKEVTHHS